MGDLFYWLLNMSITASLTGVIIIALRRLQKIPRQLIAILWGIPLLRFWCPIGVGGKYGLMSLLARFTTKTVVVYKGKLANYSMTNSMMAASSYFPITYKVDLLADVFRYAALVWAMIAVAFIIVFSILYISTILELKAIPHNSTRADGEKIWIRKKALFRRNTWCISRKSNAFAGQIFRQPPQATLCGVALRMPNIFERICTAPGNSPPLRCAESFIPKSLSPRHIRIPPTWI